MSIKGFMKKTHRSNRETTEVYLRMAVRLRDNKNRTNNDSVSMKKSETKKEVYNEHRMGQNSQKKGLRRVK